MTTPWSDFTRLEHLDLSEVFEEDQNRIAALPSLICLILQNEPYPTFSLFKALKTKLQYCRLGIDPCADDYPMSYSDIYMNSRDRMCSHGLE